MKLTKILYILFLSFIIMNLKIETAWAYLDPASGSYIFQIIMAALLGGLLVVKNFWRTIIKKIRSIFGGKDKDSGEQS